MRLYVLVPLAPLLIAAAPDRHFGLAMPPTNLDPLLGPQTRALAAPARGPVYEPAPLPNRDISSPRLPKASTEPSLAPSLFTTRNQYRGDGFAPNSTAQAEQEKRVKPGAGFTLHMPFKGQ